MNARTVCFAACLAAGTAIASVSAASAGSFQSLYTFQGGTDGSYPRSGLVAIGNRLYGTTSLAGAANVGTVFKFDPSTNREVPLYSFKGGTTDGAQPYGNLLPVNNTLYGMTAFGGASNDGTIYTVDAVTGAETVLFSFTGTATGAWPYGSLIKIGQNLYGTTYTGGATNFGTIFVYNLVSKQERVLHSFSTSRKDGEYPEAALLDVGGLLYTTTYAGGTYGGGTIVAIDPNSGEGTLVYAFSHPSTLGDQLRGALIDVNGTLFGTAAGGGSDVCKRYGCGFVFGVMPPTNTETLQYDFQGPGAADGQEPNAGLVQDGALLYGTTFAGGSVGYGSLFALDPTSGAETDLYSFDITNGANPQSTLFSLNGVLYGTTSNGSTGYGTIFAYTP